MPKARPRKKDDEEDNSWMDTYADAITLLLAFFIILVNIAEPKQSKFEEVKQGLQSEFSSEEVETPFTSIFESFSSIVDENASEDISVEETDKGVIIELDSEFMFDPGSAKIKREAVPYLEQIAYTLIGFEYEHHTIDVEGHTDNVPIKTRIYPTNWHLSSARAISLVRYFMYMGLDPMRMKASGYADTRPKAPNTDAYGNPIPENQAENRRVTIRLERED